MAEDQVQDGVPTVVPKQKFIAAEDAITLMKATKGSGADEKVIIDILTNRSLYQRLMIKGEFQRLYKKNLVKELNSKLSGNFRKTIEGLLTPRYVYYAKELYEAMKGLGTDEDTLIEILCSLSNSEILLVKEIYERKYKTTLEEDIKGDTSGDFEKLLLSICGARRDDTITNNSKLAQNYAKSLQRKDIDDSTLNRILCCTSYPQLRLVFEEYEKLASHNIEKAIEKKFSGDAKNGYLAMIQCVRDRPVFFAQQFYKSMKGLGTNDGKLVRLVVTRCEVDLEDIKNEYGKRFSESLADAVKGDTSGDYRKCLLALIGET